MDLLQQVAANLAIEEGKAEKGIGAVLMALRMAIPKDAFEQVKHAIPNAESMMGRALMSSGRTGEMAAVTGPAGLLAALAAAGINKADIPRLGRLDNPDATATALSKLCGSTVTIDLKMDGDTVTDFSHQVKACALGQASSSIMARNVIGAKARELRDLRETVRRMLKENGAPPGGKWADIAVLEPVRDYKARHASTMLTFDAVASAIDQIEAKRRAAMVAE